MSQQASNFYQLQIAKLKKLRKEEIEKHNQRTADRYTDSDQRQRNMEVRLVATQFKTREQMKRKRLHNRIKPMSVQQVKTEFVPTHLPIYRMQSMFGHNV